MVQSSSFSYRRNLERIGEEAQAGAWRVVPLLDQVSEKRFLLFSLRSRTLTELAPSVLTFRSETAASISPSTCPPVFSTTIDGDRVEFITEYFSLLRPTEQTDDDLRLIFDSIIQAFTIFEYHRFHCSDLFPESIGRDADGKVIILPNAYLLPFISREESLPTSVGLRIDMKSPNKLRTLDAHFEFDSGRVHTSLVGKLIKQLVPTDSNSVEGDAFRNHLLEVTAAIDRGDLTTLDELYQRILGTRLPTSDRRFFIGSLESQGSPEIEAGVDRVVNQVTAEGSVIIIKGDSHTGKSRIMKKAASLMDRSESFSVFSVDEWDLFSKSRRRSIPRGKPSVHCVWMIDDIDEKALAYSEFSTAMLESDSYPKGTAVLSVRSTGVADEVGEFLEKLREQRGDRYHEILAEAGGKYRESVRLTTHIRSALEALDPPVRPDAAEDTPSALIKVLLSQVTPEERQLLEFVSVARFAMPLDLVLSVFSESGEQIRAAILRLTSLYCLELVYRRTSPRNAVSLFVKMQSTALRRLIYDSAPPERRRKLHRTIALLAEQHGAFPKYFLLFHSLQSEDEELAAKHAVSFLKEKKSEKRHPYLVSLCVQLTKKNLLSNLPFSDQILAYHELSADLLDQDRWAEAEALLVRCKQLIETARGDEKLKNAPRLSAIYRLLADRQEARGEFKRALGLLDLARDQLQSALPIPDQAQLLNDIGWLQYRLGDYEKSMESCRLSLNTLNANQYPIIVSQALNLMGVVHFNTSRYDEAISYYEQSAYLRERSGDENALAASFNNLALAYQSKGEFEKAFDYHEKSLELKRRQNNRAGIAGGYLNLALLHLEGRNFKEAEAKCRESLAISQELKNAQLAADNYITLGDIASEGGDLEAAEHHYQESFRISNQREAINEEMGALRRLSTICLKQERYEEAREYAEAAHELVLRIGSRYENAQIEVIFGDLELKQGRPTDALKHYEKASGQYTALSKYRFAATVLSKIGLIHAKAGNNFEAGHYLDRAQEFVRTDIGRELPEEFVKLQQVLRAHPARTRVVAGESQKLLRAFYELSALTDYTPDRDEFFRKIMDVTKQIVDPLDCCLALDRGTSFLLLDDRGDRNPVVPRGMNRLFRRALLRGSLVDSRSPDVADLLGEIKLPEENEFVCIPLKTMGENLGCLLFYLSADRLPFSNEDLNFFTWLGRQIAGNLKLMLHLNEDFLKEEILDNIGEEGHASDHVKPKFENLIGKSEAMKKIFRTLEKVKETDSGILILGESGTGKSALARAIHYTSPRQNRAFQEIHCAQIPYNLLESELFGHERGSFTGAVHRKVGLCELADGGTLFLDDINVMPVETQTKLLHFLASKSFMRLGGTQRLTSDVRIIVASNEDLEKMCKEGKFREDLYYRLKVILIYLPPLRERKEDMLAIAVDYLKRSCADKGIPLRTLSPESITLFQKAPWRGNVRELQNVLERVVVLSDEAVITPSSLPEDFLKEVMGMNRHGHQRLDDLVDEIVRLGSYSEANPLLPLLEALLAKRMVEHMEGKSRAATMLGISKPTLYARLRDYEKMH